MSVDQRLVIVTPGRVAYVSPAAKEQFTDKPRMVTWNPYLEELLTDHGDIQVVEAAKAPVRAAPVARPASAS